MIIAKPAQLARVSFARAHDNKEAYKLLSNKCNKTINSLIVIRDACDSDRVKPRKNNCVKSFKCILLKCVSVIVIKGASKN